MYPSILLHQGLMEPLLYRCIKTIVMKVVVFVPFHPTVAVLPARPSRGRNKLCATVTPPFLHSTSWALTSNRYHG